ncbi:ThiF family adenylyltransferase [Tuberibacillus sp. Marseille-P3662]|uniref:ThiF family adenylyltransferase n=1 Tax=Tuberibacillus sp. Marseille-P3662 TaxID=1965358 RepID=UPI000A1C92AD|nr:ThiF family adenylyltransferase [Tuberibacillus sp. Marseille-P3662]
MNERYSRQTLFSPIGDSGQQKLNTSKVLIVGAGALGTAAAEMLVRAGIGHLVIVDRDYVEWSNLQRQQLYTETDAEAGTPKATAAAERLKAVNHEVDIQPYVSDFFDYVRQHFTADVDVIIDATDNFETRLFINDLAQRHCIPWIYGGATASTGMTYTFVPGVTPCFSCLLPTMPTEQDTCDTVGVIAPIIQWVTSHQVTEAMKLLTGNQASLRGTLIFTDIWGNEQTSMKMDQLKKDDCPSCGHDPTYPYLQTSSGTKTAVLCGRDTVQIRPLEGERLEPEAVKQKLEGVAQKLAANDLLIHARLDDKRRIVVFHDGRVLLHGMQSVEEAQSIYDRHIRTT